MKSIQLAELTVVTLIKNRYLLCDEVLMRIVPQALVCCYLSCAESSESWLRQIHNFCISEQLLWSVHILFLNLTVTLSKYILEQILVQ